MVWNDLSQGEKEQKQNLIDEQLESFICALDLLVFF
jgi:hypothetical protein